MTCVDLSLPMVAYVSLWSICGQIDLCAMYIFQWQERQRLLCLVFWGWSCVREWRHFEGGLGIIQTEMSYRYALIFEDFRGKNATILSRK